MNQRLPKGITCHNASGSLFLIGYTYVLDFFIFLVAWSVSLFASSKSSWLWLCSMIFKWMENSVGLLGQGTCL